MLMITEDRSVFVMVNGSPVQIEPDADLLEKIKDLAPGTYDESFSRMASQ